MTKKIKYLIILNVVLLGLVSLSLRESDEHSTLDLQSTAFAVLDTGLVLDIHIGNVLIRREQGNSWSVNREYLADGRRVAQLLTLLPRLEVKRPAPAHLADSLAQALSSKGVLIEAVGANGTLKAYRMAAHDGDTYALLPDGKPFSVYIPGYKQVVADWLLVDAQEWRDKHVLFTSWQTMKELSISVTNRPSQNLHIYFDKDFYKIDGVSALDSVKLYDYIGLYTQFEARAYLPASEAATLTDQAPVAHIIVEDLYTKTRTDMALYPANNALYGWIAETETLVSLDPALLQPLLVPPAYFERRN